jgi:hypothetical protein
MINQANMHPSKQASKQATKVVWLCGWVAGERNTLVSGGTGGCVCAFVCVCSSIRQSPRLRNNATTQQTTDTTRADQTRRFIRKPAMVRPLQTNLSRILNSSPDSGHEAKRFAMAAPNTVFCPRFSNFMNLCPKFSSHTATSSTRILNFELCLQYVTRQLGSSDQLLGSWKPSPPL